MAGTSTRATVDRIVATFNRATPRDVENGAQWYGDAGAVAAELARAADITTERAACVLAALSPRTSWSRNVSGAWSLITTGEAPMCLRANVARAYRVLAADDGAELDALGAGPKVRAFALNIIGDRESVTVDVWAARVALGAREDAELILARAGAYDAVAHAYRLAARRLGVDPVTVQATTWCVARNGRAL